MKRRLKNRIAFVLVAFFALGILCSTLAAPTQAIASVSGCSQTGRAMEMADCEHPGYFCGFDGSSNIFSQGVVNSVRSNDSLKNVLGVAVGEPPLDASQVGAPAEGKDCSDAFPTGSLKVFVRLFNSTLNL
jgi:hypothetical protein